MSWEFFNKRTVKGLKEYRCCECDVALPAGTSHVYCSGKVEGEISSYRLCETCDLISTEWCFAFDDGEGWPMGGLRAALRELDVHDAEVWAAGQRDARGAKQAERDAAAHATAEARRDRLARLSALAADLESLDVFLGSRSAEAAADIRTLLEEAAARG